MKTLESIAADYDFVVLDNSIFHLSNLITTINVDEGLLEESLEFVRYMTRLSRKVGNFVFIDDVREELDDYLRTIKKSRRFTRSVSRRYGRNPSHDREDTSLRSAKVSVKLEEILENFKSLKKTLKKNTASNEFDSRLSENVFRLVEVVAGYVSEHHPYLNIQKEDSRTDECLIATAVLYPLSRKGRSALVTDDKGIRFVYRIVNYVMSLHSFFPDNGYIFDALEDFPSFSFRRYPHKGKRSFYKVEPFDGFFVRDKKYFREMRKVVKSIESFVDPRKVA